MVHYETAQAHMEDQMRKAAVWRMQRAAMDARKAARKTAHKHAGKQENGAQRSGSWMDTIRKAFGGNITGGSLHGDPEAADSFSGN